MYQTPQSSNHQLQNVPPPSYFETQYQRSNSHRTAPSGYVIPSSGQSKIHQGCPIHRLQSCSCRMVEHNYIYLLFIIFICLQRIIFILLYNLLVKCRIQIQSVT